MPIPTSAKRRRPTLSKMPGSSASAKVFQRDGPAARVARRTWPGYEFEEWAERGPVQGDPGAVWLSADHHRQPLWRVHPVGARRRRSQGHPRLLQFLQGLAAQGRGQDRTAAAASAWCRSSRASLTDSGYGEEAVNVPNEGLIDDLPDWLAVEVPATVDAAGRARRAAGATAARVLRACCTTRSRCTT